MSCALEVVVPRTRAAVEWWKEEDECDEVNESIADVVVDGDGEMQTRSGLQFPSTAHYDT